MGKRKGAQKQASVVSLAAPAPSTPKDLTLQEIAMPRKEDRYSRATAYAGVGIETLASTLRNSETGSQVQAQDLFDYMLETDPHLASVCQTRVLGVASLKWSVTPGKVAQGSPEEAMAKAVADFAQRALEELPRFSRARKSLAHDGILKGYGVHEIMWERRDGAWLPSALKWRHPRRFRVGVEWDIRLDDNGTRGPNGQELCPTKFIVHVPKERPQYETRCGVLRAAAFDWLFKKWMTKFALSAGERFGTPTPYGHVDENASETVRRTLREGIENLSAGQAAVFAGQTAIATLDTGSTNVDLFETMIGVFNANISKLVLGSTGNVELGANGSQAALKSQASSTIDPRIASDAQELEETINESLIKPLVEFNLHLFGGVIPPMPRFEFTLAEETERPITPDLWVGGVFSMNEIRASYGKDPRQGAEGDAPVNIQAPAQPRFSAAPTLGGESTDRPLASSLSRHPQSTPTSATSVPFAMTPLGRALSKQ